MFDVIIIGKGPAGISAALYTVRANFKTLIIGKDSLLKKADKIDNYYGFKNSISGKDLLESGESQARRLGAKFIEEEVIDIKLENDIKKVITTNNTFECKALLLATGERVQTLKIQNLQEFEGKGISYCTVCDGFFFRGLKVGLIGYGDYAIHEAMELLNFTNDITIYTHGNEFEISDKFQKLLNNFKVDKRKIASFKGEDELKSICFEDGDSENIDGIFIAYQSATGSSLAKKTGILEKDKFIQTNTEQETSIHGIFAAGDCTGVFKQISVAVGQGAIAGRGIIKYLRNIV